MKSSLFILFLLSVFFPVCLSGVEQPTPLLHSYIIKLLTASSALKATGLNVYYKGNPFVFNEENICVITEKKRRTFTVVITQEIEIVIKKNQKKYFKLKKDAHFLWYDLDLVVDDPVDPFITHAQYHWHINPRLPQEVAARIPDNALIILLDPDFIEELHNPELELHKKNQLIEQNSRAFTLYFPLIKIKKDITPQQFKQSLMKHACELEMKTLHKTPEVALKQVNQQHIITLPCI
ncbi:MAG: hypothetical protein WA432_01555 [Candidatus Babeliaceae bacterium]